MSYPAALSVQTVSMTGFTRGLQGHLHVFFNVDIYGFLGLGAETGVSASGQVGRRKKRGVQRDFWLNRESGLGMGDRDVP